MPAPGKRLRQLLDAHRTILAWLGVGRFAARGYYVPYRYASGHPRPREDEVFDWCEARLEAAAAAMLEHLSAAAAYSERLGRFRHADPGEPDAPRFDQAWFSGLDAAIAYTMVRTHRPRRIVEVGSGHSTRFLARAVADAGLDTELTSIDPQPRRGVDRLCARIHRGSVVGVDPELFRSLEADDVLFVDSSHVAMPGSDVDFLFTQVLPVLRCGVLVHLHDVFLPRAYPERWPFDDYSEQHMLLALLAGGTRFEVRFASAYVRARHAAAAAAVDVPVDPQASESSFWMRVRTEPEAHAVPRGS